MNHSQYPRILNSLASGSSLARANGSKALGMADSGFEGIDAWPFLLEGIANAYKSL